MTPEAQTGKPFTGWHFLAIMVAFFGTIITVNLVMAYYANSTWSGLVVQNSYVASQEFNGKVAEVKRQDELGWKPSLTSANNVISWQLTTKEGQPVVTDTVHLTLSRPVTDTEDLGVDLVKGPDGIWTSEQKLHDGLWIAVVDAQTRDAGNWRETVRFTVKDGAF